jgi:hypothetical membrane protein
MKEIIAKTATTVIKILALYVFVMSAITAGCTGVAKPELGMGAMVIAVFLLIMADTAGKGGVDHDSGSNET